MNAINTIRQWCSSKGYSFCYGNPMDVNRWMTETDFSASTDSTAVFIYLLTTSEYDGSKDSYNVGIYFAELCDLDFNNQTIDTTTEALKERAKALLTDLSQGNAVGWSGARFTYGYDDYAENVVWCCLRVTLTALASECVPMPAPPAPQHAFVDISAKLMELETGETANPLCDGFAGVDNGEGGTYVTFGAALSETSISENDIEAMVNGVEIDKSGIVAAEITEEIITTMPDLADYAGWWLAALFTTVVNGDKNTITVTVAGFNDPFTCTFES